MKGAVTDRFLDDPNEDTFTALLQVFAPQLVLFFRARSHELSLAEDLPQEVMLTVYCKTGQIRDPSLFRAWLLKVAHNALCRRHDRMTREVETVNLADVVNRLLAASHKPAGTPVFEFRNWLHSLDPRERDFMILRVVDQWHYHEIAAARGTADRHRAVENLQRKETTCRTSDVAAIAVCLGGHSDGYLASAPNLCLLMSRPEYRCPIIPLA
jgi:RNA polymerase sigma factor (sigma-70 family)